MQIKSYSLVLCFSHSQIILSNKKKLWGMMGRFHASKLGAVAVPIYLFIFFFQGLN